MKIPYNNLMRLAVASKSKQLAQYLIARCGNKVFAVTQDIWVMQEPLTRIHTWQANGGITISNRSEHCVDFLEDPEVWGR